MSRALHCSPDPLLLSPSSSLIFLPRRFPVRTRGTKVEPWEDQSPWPSISRDTLKAAVLFRNASVTTFYAYRDDLYSRKGRKESVAAPVCPHRLAVEGIAGARPYLLRVLCEDGKGSYGRTRKCYL